MDILELDEAQGLTEEMVVGYLEKSGWKLTRDGSSWEQWEDNVRVSAMRADVDLSRLLELIACGGSLSAVLRDINPRMRPFPSRAAQEAHPGKWLCRCDGHVVVGRFTRPDHFLHGEWAAQGSFIGYSMDASDRQPGVLFWPCDDFAQRVRWPEVDGQML